MARDIAQWSRRKCGYCGKEIITEDPVHWAYREGNTLYCTWSCLCAHRRMMEEKKRLTERGRKPQGGPIPGSFGEWLREERQRAGYSQAALAEAAGVAHGIISHYELGKVLPEEYTRQKLAAALGCRDYPKGELEG